MVILFQINLAQNEIKFPLFYLLKIILYESLMSLPKYHIAILFNELDIKMLVSKIMAEPHFQE